MLGDVSFSSKELKINMLEGVMMNGEGCKFIVM